MKVKNNIPPSLLATGTPDYWQIRITMRGGAWADLRFSEKASAQTEYNRIRGTSIFGERWIDTIELNEVRL